MTGRGSARRGWRAARRGGSSRAALVRALAPGASPRIAGETPRAMPGGRRAPGARWRLARASSRGETGSGALIGSATRFAAVARRCPARPVERRFA
jgi:hypothetical protein